jgi:SAM-dependent methyltransferase
MGGRESGMMPAAKPLRSARWLIARTMLAVGIPLRLRSPGRDVLESAILPYCAAHEPFRKVLFVGCDWYTKRYERLFRERDYVTIDVDPERRPFGGRRHIVDSMVNLMRHFASEELDLILCNGVFGWGLDNREESKLAFAACYTALRPGGVLMLGWDDVPEHRPFDPEGLDELRRFARWTFPPFGRARHVVDNDRHVYDFFRKPHAPTS